MVRCFSPALIRDVLIEFPEFHTELGALAILRNLLLWSMIGKFETARRIAETYPILIRSAPFVVQSFRKHGGRPIGGGLGDDRAVAYDDEPGAAAAGSARVAGASGSSGGGAADAAAEQRRAARRHQRRANQAFIAPPRAQPRISRNQLADALRVAAGALQPGFGSLAAAALEASASGALDTVPTAPSASGSAAAPIASTSAASAASAPLVAAVPAAPVAAVAGPSTSGALISSSVFEAALRDAYINAYQGGVAGAAAAAAAPVVGAAPQQPPPNDAEPIEIDDADAGNDGDVEADDDDEVVDDVVDELADDIMDEDDGFEPEVPPAVSALAADGELHYAQELRLMAEMGLADVQRNLAALHMCDGDVERAVELLLASGEAAPAAAQ